jgi:LysR family transcriptional regulator for bpeEF and oprC
VNKGIWVAINLLNAMQVFVRVVETGSFTKAADALQMEVPRVTRAVQSLEAHLNTRLLNRSTRHVSVTEHGKRCLDHCRAVLEHLHTLEDEMIDADASPRGVLRVDLPAVIAHHIVIPALPTFLARYPELRVELSTTDRRVDLVKEGLDCIIRTGLLDDIDLVAKPLGASTTVMCAAPAYLARYGTPLTLADLAQHRAVNYRSSQTGRIRRWALRDETGTEVMIDMKDAVAVTDANAFLQCALSGLGIVLTSLFATQAQIARGELHEVLREYRPAPRRIWLLRAPGTPLRKVAAFSDWIGELCMSIPSLQEDPFASAAVAAPESAAS